jgi:plastocyanin
MSRIRTLLAAGAGLPLLPALAVLALVLAACGAGASADQSPVATTSVDLPKSYRFAPAAIVVEAGSTVTWTNHDNFTHNVTFEGSAPLTMAPGESVSDTLATPGLYAYVCSLHPKDMKGSVLVTGS